MKGYVLVWLLVCVAVMGFCGCAAKVPVVGGDRDAHGCIGSAGYTWCKATQKCIRVWEEPCEPDDTITDVDRK